MRQLSAAARVIAAAGVGGLSLVACLEERKPVPPPPPPAAELRVVSLSPAISRTLADFSLHEWIVGRTPWCASVDPAVPVVGDLINIDYELMVRLRPTHVLVQPPSTGIPPEFQAVAQREGWRVVDWRLNSIEDIAAMTASLPDQLFVADSPAHERALERSAALSASIVACTGSAPDSIWRGSTLIVESVDPVLAFGSETYLHDLLVAMGGVNASTARGWAQLSLEDVAKLNPDAIILVDPRAGREDSASTTLGPLASLAIDAIAQGRVAALTHPDALLPSTAVIEVADELKGILHRFHESGP